MRQQECTARKRTLARLRPSLTRAVAQLGTSLLFRIEHHPIHDPIIQPTTLRISKDDSNVPPVPTPATKVRPIALHWS